MKYEENILSHSKQTLANYTAFGVALAFASMLTAFAAHAQSGDRSSAVVA
jgi:hypothetical protein